MKKYNNTIFDAAKHWATKFIFGEPRAETAGHINVSTSTIDLALDGQSNTFEQWLVEAYENNEVVCGALNLIANTFAEADIKVLDDDGNHLDMSNTQILLNHISSEQTQRQFFTTLVHYLYLGSAVFIEKARDSRGRVTALYPIRPDRMRIHATPEDGITHYSFELGGVHKRLEKEDVIFIPFVSPRSPYFGYSPLWSLVKTINSDNSAKCHTEELLANRGRPGALITTENEMDPEEAYAMAKSWDRSFEGAKNGSTGILWSGAQYSQIGMTLKDLDFTSLRKVDEAKILSTLRIPLAVYGSITGSEASTFNNVKESKRQFWEQCIIPLQNLVLDALNDDPELSEEGTIVFDKTEVLALQEDADAVADRCLKLYQGGVITLNETRTKIGMDETPDGDDFFSPPSPFGDLGADDDEEKDYSEIIEAKISEEMKNVEANEEMLKKSIEDDLRNQLHIALGREALATKFLRKTKKMAKTLFEKQIKDVLDLVGNKSHKEVKQFESGRINNGLDSLRVQWEVEIEEASQDTIGSLIDESATASMKSVGVDPDGTEVFKASRSYTRQLAKGIAKTSVKELRGVIDTAFKENLTLGQLSQRIQDKGNQWTKTRANAVARTETSRAANVGARLGYKASGVVKKLMYSAILDGSTSDICSELHGKIIPIDDSFVGGSTLVTGAGKTFDLSYSGSETPPLHPNCRSTIIPIIEER